ncbi:MAG: energy transducer TonB [Paludibacteraceae bacterium]|nr:energy transducer TonB [Paludibacteraceae bacterium]
MNRVIQFFILAFVFVGASVTSLYASDKDSFSREASFPGGNEGLSNYLRTNVTYPESALKNNETGKVFVSFVVEKDGSIGDVKVEKGVSADLDNVAMKVVREMPKWTPAMKDGKEVRTSLTLPIVFHLPNKVLEK